VSLKGEQSPFSGEKPHLREGKSRGGAYTLTPPKQFGNTNLHARTIVVLLDSTPGIREKRAVSGGGGGRRKVKERGGSFYSLGGLDLVKK